MEQISISASPRVETGKCPAKRLRANGRVPAILYGAAVKDVKLSLINKEIEKVLHTAAGGNVLVNLILEGETKPRMVMCKDVDRHPLKGTIRHVDLYEIQMDHKLTVEVPIHLTGKAEGLAFGGIVQIEARRIKVECLPTSIPDSFDLDITSLGIGHSLHVRDLQLGVGVKALADPDMTIVSLVAPTAEAAPKTAEEIKAELAKSFEEKEAPEKEEKEKK